MDELRMYAINAAHVMNREHAGGSIEVGKRADMVLLSHDPTAVHSDFLRELAVEQTYGDSEIMHGIQVS